MSPARAPLSLPFSAFRRSFKSRNWEGGGGGGGGKRVIYFSALIPIPPTLRWRKGFRGRSNLMYATQSYSILP